LKGIIAYSNLNEPEVIQYFMDYTRKWITNSIQSFPEEYLYKIIIPNMPSAAVLYGEMVVSERIHIGLFAQCIDDIPNEFNALRRYNGVSHNEKVKACKPIKRIIDYYDVVGQQTNVFLKSLTPELLRNKAKNTGLPDCNPNKDNPVRVFFIMQLHYQNNIWGRIIALKYSAGLPQTKEEEWV
jgi:hypothetical protein